MSESTPPVSVSELVAPHLMAPDWETYRTLIESLPIGIVVYRDGTVVYANPHLLTLLHWPPDEVMIGQPIRDVMQRFFVQEERAQGEARLEAANQGNRLPPVERRLRTPDGELRVVELSTLTVPFESGPAQMTLARDMTEQRLLMQRLQSQERMVSVGRVAAGVAHELNNPLAFLLGSLELLERDLPRVVMAIADLPFGAAQSTQQSSLLDDCAAVLDRLHEASEGGRRVQAIMQDLRAISQAGGQPLRPLDLRRPLQSALALARRELTRKARLTVDLRETPLVDGDEARLSQVFLNLLIHATETLPDHAEPIHDVRVVLFPEGGQAVVEIADTGLGIAGDELQHLFEPFQSSKPKGVGSGLGLTLCRDIVQQHHGQIDAFSAPGEGLRIRVTLPLSVAVPPPPRPALVTGTPRARVLVVDDEPQVSNILRQVLEQEHDVTIHTSAEIALAEMEAGQRFDAILCDLMMPGMGGQAFYAALLQRLPEQAERVAFVTGGAFTPDAARFLQASGRPTLDKPFAFAEVRHTVRVLAGGTEPAA